MSENLTCSFKLILSCYYQDTPEKEMDFIYPK